MRDRLLLFLAPRIGSFVLRLVGLTYHHHYIHEEIEKDLMARGKPLIYAFWHRWLLIPTCVEKERKITALISQHFDGELIAQTILRRGFRVARGSSTRAGAAGLKAMVNSAAAGNPLSINPDGPRGPARKVHPGVVYLAGHTGCPIVPVGFGASSRWEFNSWDRFVVPKPLSTTCMVMGEPIHVQGHPGGDELKALQDKVHKGICRADEIAEEFVAQYRRK